MIKWSADIAAAAEADLAERVRIARVRGDLSWREIGEAIGVTAQAAHRRFADRPPGPNPMIQREIEAIAVLDDVLNS